ncbi:MAG TPA: response regulator [Actinomycetota bacterium]|jgi:DNA-binding response OmpR family regulator|nr:response regulator [Actinomycetota bacterium]
MGEPEPHVLVVDDDPVIVRLLELNFRLGGFRVSSARRGDQAVDRALEVSPDAIVLDVTMPGIDGYEVCRRLRDDHGMHEVPVVLLTAHAQDEDHARGDALGISAYVTKPFDPEVLVVTVREALRSGGPP